LAELGKIEVNCDFCNKHYAFDAIDAAALFASETAVAAPKIKH
jgi:molecular chaperone Hsp33